VEGSLYFGIFLFFRRSFGRTLWSSRSPGLVLLGSFGFFWTLVYRWRWIECMLSIITEVLRESSVKM